MNHSNSVKSLGEGMDREELRYQAFCADRVVNLLNPAPGDKVLDACAGTGAISLAMAQAVGPAGRVTAIDPSEEMLARLEAKIRQFGVGNIDVHGMAGGRLDFRRDYFHAVACSLAWEAPQDPVAAAREWWRVLRPGGSVLWSVFARDAFQPFADQLRAAQLRIGAEAAELPWMTLAGPDTAAGMLRAAGFEKVTIEKVVFGYHLPDAMAWWQVVTFGPLHDWLRPLSEARLDELRGIHLAEVGRSLTADGLWLDVPVLIVRGFKPVP